MNAVFSFYLPWISGLGTGLGLFAAVGAQSAFILRQGLQRAHIGSVLAVCAAVDALCIASSVLAWRAVADRAVWMMPAMAWCGAAFLAIYAVRSARRAWSAGGALAPARRIATTRRDAMLAALAFTVINPHFWLDIVLIGTLAQAFGHNAAAYAAGAITASALWLLVLGGGARLLRPLFRDPRAWRVLDGGIAIVMATLALRLLARVV
ncbi:LysE/ArgO family amino acid transporter [Bordetella genomosp. 11]|uniref:Lysine transporter LysE n=1 Tax=Bordetella genomosp. 11 TaxID=1416808 RepID=A0A261ULZ7_9BORD|nr:LysE family transporter [Bordetella genomosp. 11]OZI62904.1 lysine transporter LysE [Bordetella genomosp. 11]